MKPPITTAQAMQHPDVVTTINTLWQMADELRTRLAEVERGLADAAQSLETVALLSGRKSYGMPPIETYMETCMEVRAYAAARAGVAREAIDAAMKEHAKELKAAAENADQAKLMAEGRRRITYTELIINQIKKLPV